VARENDLSAAMLRAQFNLSGLLIEQDRLAEAQAVLEEALAFARRRGDRTWEAASRGQLGEVLVATGEWSRAYELLEDIEHDTDLAFGHSIRLAPVVALLVGYGRIDEADALLRREHGLESSDLQTQAVYVMLESDILRARGRPAEALPLANKSIEIWRSLYQPHYAIEAYARAFDSAFDAGDIEAAEEALRGLEGLKPIERRMLGVAHAHRFRGHLAAHRGEDPHADFAAAAETFREMGAVYWLAVTLAEHAEHGGDGADEARQIFTRLGATPWLERLSPLAV
jgi:tetratricopeptide (TPR) repeat protein